MRRGAPTRRPIGAAPSGARGSEAAASRDAVRAWVRLVAVYRHALGALRDDFERDMTLARFELLATLARQDGQSLAALARAMERESVNLRGIVNRAARDGLVDLRTGSAERRAWRVHLSAKGRRMLEDAERRYARRVGRLFARLSRSEIAVLSRMLEKLRASSRAPAERRARVERGAEPAAARGTFDRARSRTPMPARRSSRRRS